MLRLGRHYALLAQLLAYASMIGCSPAGAGQWQRTTVGSFSFEMPGQPMMNSMTQDTPLGEIKYDLYQLAAGGQEYAFSTIELPAVLAKPQGQELEQRLDSAQAGSLANIKAKLLTSEKVSYEGFQGRDFTGQLPNLNVVRGRQYLIHRTLVQMLAVNVNSRDVTRFFDSFKIIGDRAGAEGGRAAKPNDNKRESLP